MMNHPTAEAPVQIDEHTPLLGAVGHGHAIPTISSALMRIAAVPPSQIPVDDLLPFPIPDPSTKMAFTLTVLLQLRRTKLQSSDSLDAYDRWFRKTHDTDGVEALENRIIFLWAQFLEQCPGIREIEAVLWTRIPLEESMLRVVRGLSLSCCL